MHRRLEIGDFKVEVVETNTLDELRIYIEVRGEKRPEIVQQELKLKVREIFELTPEVLLLQLGTLEKEFQSQVKQQRFIDKRG